MSSANEHDAVRLDVVRVPIEAEIVVGHDDVGLVALHEAGKRARRLVDGHPRKASGASLLGQPIIPESW